ncbi:hypothetical protein FFK22_005150 [Mycobacterium sp. KBS0706]|uniref:hypothetical protein n=1 Tax=Mycobacterium sp. KBS0706 TaxID=2578109 RepID=UPI00110FBE3E|nr:hypothetical protein [Mycobacterium sp. KBS0706]TSD89902.1 hypothetical protein FFK22_005150 [Mycobacterium sp. KBS0706]
MVTYVHNKARAKKSVAWIEETQRNGAECCIALAHLGFEGQSVALVMPSGLSGLTKKLQVMDYEGKPKKITTKKEKDQYKLIAIGLAKLGPDNVLNVRLKKGSAQSLHKGLREYFRGGFGLEVPYDSIGTETNLPEDQENLFAQTEAENQLKFSSEETETDQPASAAEQPIPPVGKDPDSDSEGSPILTPTASEAGDDDVPEEDLMEGVEESESEDEDDEDNPLSDELKQGIATASATIAGHALSLSREIGVGQKAELGPLTDKIAAWLEDMLAGLSPEEREMRLHNLTSRLLLMLAYPENLRNLQYVDAAPAAGDGDQDKPGREKLLVNGIDLDNVSTDDLNPEEVTESLFKLAKARAQERLLPYPLNQASPDRIAGMVASGWPKEDGDAEGKRKAVQRLVAVVQQMFAKDDQLIGLLGFKKNDAADGDNLVASLVESIKEVWEAHRNAAIKQKDELKQKVQQIIGTRVENLGGTWGHVDDIFLQIDGEISDQLAAISGQEGDARAKAIDAAADTVQTNLSYLDGNNIVDLLDNPPFDVGQGAVGETLREGLTGVSDGLKRIESLSVAAAA